MQFEAAEEHLSAVVNSTRRAGHPSRRGVRRWRDALLVSGSRSADSSSKRAGVARRRAGASRRRALARARVRSADGRDGDAAAASRAGRASRPVPRPGTRSSRIRSRRENPHRSRAASARRLGADAAADAGAGRACRRAAAVRGRRTPGSWRCTPCGSPSATSSRCGCSTGSGGRPSRGPCRQAGPHPRAARRIALAQGSLHDAQIEAETGLRLITGARISRCRSSSRWRSSVHIEAGISMTAGDARADRRGGSAADEDRLYVDHFLTARGRLRIAQGQCARGSIGPLVVRRAAGGAGRAVAVRMAGARCRRRSPRSASTSRRWRWRASSWRLRGRSGRRGHWACRCARRRASAATPRLCRCSRRRSSVLEPSPAKLELAHALGDLGGPLSRAGRRREGRDAQRAGRSSSPTGVGRLRSPRQRAPSSRPGRGARHGPS